MTDVHAFGTNEHWNGCGHPEGYGEYQDEPTFAVYVVAIKDTSEGFDALCDLPGLATWAMADAGLPEDRAIELAEQIA